MVAVAAMVTMVAMARGAAGRWERGDALAAMVARACAAGRCAPLKAQADVCARPGESACQLSARQLSACQLSACQRERPPAHTADARTYASRSAAAAPTAPTTAAVPPAPTPPPAAAAVNPGPCTLDIATRSTSVQGPASVSAHVTSVSPTHGSVRVIKLMRCVSHSPAQPIDAKNSSAAVPQKPEVVVSVMERHVRPMVKLANGMELPSAAPKTQTGSVMSDMSSVSVATPQPAWRSTGHVGSAKDYHVNPTIRSFLELHIAKCTGIVQEGVAKHQRRQGNTRTRPRSGRCRPFAG